MNSAGRILLLNGAGSVGKSSIARALQAITTEPFLHVEMDAFLNMMPEHLFDRPEGFVFEELEEDGFPVVEIATGPVGEKCMAGMRCAIAAMAAQGNNLIVDDVMLDDAAAHYREVLHGFEVSWVGIFAPLEVLEERELERGDRLIGLARWQFDRVHRNIRYDLKIDASRSTPMECAVAIKERFGL